MDLERKKRKKERKRKKRKTKQNKKTLQKQNKENTRKKSKRNQIHVDYNAHLFFAVFETKVPLSLDASHCRIH